LLSKPSELPSAAFFLSQKSSESIPSRDKLSKMTDRILAEYHQRIQSLWVKEAPYRSSSFHFYGLALPLVPTSDVP